MFQARTMEKEGVISLAMVPIVSKQRAMGFIAVGSKKFHKFTKREVRLLVAFSSQLGSALENAQLYDEVNKEKAYIENLVDNAGDAIISTDVEDRILTWNHGAEVIFGYSKEETVGQSLTILLPSHRAGELEEIRDKVRLTGVIRNLEVRRIRKDGIIIEASLAVSPIRDKDDNVIGFLHLARDVTEKKRYEERLKELDKMKSAFVSNVSHELRTPLTAIKASADNMLDRLIGDLNGKQVGYLTRIKSNSDRLARLINDLLDLSTIEAGKIDLRPTNLPLVTLVKEAAESLRPVAAEKLINLTVMSADPGVIAWADRDKVIQVLMNLIGNALKFTPARGKVTIAVAKNSAAWMQISVTDTGPGIPAEEVNKVFGRFYQIGQAARKRPKGQGSAWRFLRPWWRCMAERSGRKVNQVKEAPFPSRCLRSNRFSLNRRRLEKTEQSGSKRYQTAALINANCTVLLGPIRFPDKSGTKARFLSRPRTGNAPAEYRRA